MFLFVVVVVNCVVIVFFFYFEYIARFETFVFVLYVTFNHC